MAKRIEWRYVMSILLSIGLAIIYGLKVNISVAIISMVNYTALKESEKVNNLLADNKTIFPQGSKNDAVDEDGPFLWTQSMQGNLLGVYYFGYLIAMFPGSQLAEIISAKWVFFFAVSLNAVCALLTPIACVAHYGVVVTLRLLQGVGGGVTFPTTHVLLAHWAPPHERSTMGSIAFSGTLLGTVVSNYCTGITALYLGWEWVFYTQGGLSILWLVLWVLFVTDKPRQLKFISEKELDLIETSLGVTAATRKKKRKVPWIKILKSRPFWGILIAHTCSNWGFYMLLTNMPIYMKMILDFDVKQVSLYTALPYLAMWAFSLVIGRTLDYYRKKKRITTTFARKFATIVGSGPTAACLLALCFLGTEKIIAVILLTVALMMMGAMFSGFMTNHIDIANNYAGTLMGMTNTIATIPGIVGPIFVGALTQEDPSMKSWRTIFYVTVGFLIVDIIGFTLLGSGEEQSWNKSSDEQVPTETEMPLAQAEKKPTTAT